MGKRVEWVTVTCEICGKQDCVTPGRAKTYKTCSIVCRTERSSRILSKRVDVLCKVCGAKIPTKPSRVHKVSYCSSAECDKIFRSRLMSGEGNHQWGLLADKNSSWKGGLLFKNKYWYVYYPDHPTRPSDKYVKRCRLVVEASLGRTLTSDEHVHHIDENTHNDSIENLMVLSLTEHVKLHNANKEIVRDPVNGRIVGIKRKEL